VKKNLPRLLLGAFCVVFFLGHAAHVWHVPFVTALDAYLYDVRVRLFMPNTLDERVVIVDIDEKSLAEVGRWPWGRQHVGEMVRKLIDDYHVSVVGFDVVFAEPDESSGLKVLEKIGRQELKEDAGFQKSLGQLRHKLDYDQRFADILSGRPVVLGYYFSSMSDAQIGGLLPPPVFSADKLQGLDEQFINWKGYGANLPVFQKAAMSGGHFNPLVDFDGVSRRVPLLVGYENNLYESLSLAMVRTLFGQAALRLGQPAAGAPVEWLEVVTPNAVLSIPVDENVAALIPYRGGERSFRYLSAVDVLKGRIPLADLQGKMVLVGTTAPGLNDLRATPVGGTYPGVEIHANLIAGMLDGNIKEKPGFVMAIEVLHILLLGGLLALILPALSPLRSTLLTVVVLLASAGFNFWLWQSANLVIPLASGGVLVIALLYALNMSWGYFVETRSKRQFTELFGQYVPPELVDEMAKNPESYTMDGRNEELTVLFSDVRSFTTISEGLDPQELTRLMNEYLGVMTEVVRRHRGTLDKYIGDAIMAFWGAPVSDPNHATNAVLTALSMQKDLQQLAEPFKARGWPELHIGVGVNTGVMTVGDMGSPVRKSYTVMGDAVNLGSRLEGITKEYGVGVVVGEQTRAKAQGILFRELDRVRVKGKDEPISIHEPLGLINQISAGVQDEMHCWENALRLYRTQDWDAAEAQLKQLAADSPDCHLYALYLERINYLRINPPGEAWDGVTTFKTK
jgi:adenylate cyclase